MRKWLNSLLLATKQYTIWDFGFLKLALFSSGLLIGIYFAQILGQYVTSIWAFFVFAYIIVTICYYRLYLKTQSVITFFLN